MLPTGGPRPRGRGSCRLENSSRAPQRWQRPPFPVCEARQSLLQFLLFLPQRLDHGQALGKSQTFWTWPRALSAHCPPGPLPAVSETAAAVGPDTAARARLPPAGTEEGLGDKAHPWPTAVTGPCTVRPVSGQKKSSPWVLGAITVLPGGAWLTGPLSPVSVCD